MIGMRELFLFLSEGVSSYCRKYHLQACHMCDRIECCDNTNPLKDRIAKLEAENAKYRAERGDK